MKYVNAKDILPREVIKTIQQYIDGEYIYIPRKDGRKKAWGENSGIREDLRQRNCRIFDKYRDGATVAELSEEFFLSEQSIRRIICQVKEQRSNLTQKHL